MNNLDIELLIAFFPLLYFIWQVGLKNPGRSWSKTDCDKRKLLCFKPWCCTERVTSIMRWLDSDCFSWNEVQMSNLPGVHTRENKLISESRRQEEKGVRGQSTRRRVGLSH